MNLTQRKYLFHGRGDYNNVENRKKLPKYLYRKETIYHRPEDEHPSLTLSGKYRVRENFIFGGAPNFHELEADDRVHNNKVYTKEELKEYKKEKDEKDKEKKKEKKKKPTPEEIREHLRLITSFHKKLIDETMPSAYPLLGYIDSDEEKESHSKSKGSSKRKNSKVENSDIRRISFNERSGRKRKNRG